MLREEGSRTIPAGVYHLVVVSEGVNPSDEWHIGSGTSRFVLWSLGQAPTVVLGDLGAFRPEDLPPCS